MAFGVYGIFFPGNYVYVGSTIANFDTRHRVHLKALKDGKHDNSLMQELYNKYGSAEFRTLEECHDKNEVRELEQYYMETLEKEYTLCNEAPALIDGNFLSQTIKDKISKGRREGSKDGDGKGPKETMGAKRKISSFDPTREDMSEAHRQNLELRKLQGW